jgi:DNA-binding CsgD family transcriptional regulator
VELIGRARFNLAYCLLEDHRLDDAAGYLDTAGFDLMERAEYLSYVPVGRALLSVIELYRARWDDAVGYARQGLSANGQLASMAATVLNRVQVRTEQPDERALHEVWQGAVRLGELPSTGFAAATLCEAAWLRGDLDTIRRVGRPAYEEACRLRHRTLPAELGFFLAEAGESPSWWGDGQPYELLGKGDWREAARRWAEYGYPYEHALALAQSGDEENLLLALEKLDELDAKPLASVVRRKLRDLGVARIPRGPQPATRHQPAGLTQRQVEVLNLLAEDLSNAEIASRLGLSARTVGNHLGAIFAKLEVRGRREAIERSRELRRRSS